MIQADYMKDLERRLELLPRERRIEVLEDICAHFEEGRLSGRPEEELAENLGSPETLAREYRALYATERAREKSSVGNVLRAIWAGIGVGMLNLLFALPAALVIFSLWISFLATGGAMALAGIATVLLTLADLVVPLGFVNVSYPWIAIFSGIAISALGLLLTLGMAVFSKALGRATVRYIQVNLDIIVGRRRKNA